MMTVKNEVETHTEENETGKTDRKVVKERRSEKRKKVKRMSE